jgi:hypothetical protein
MRRKAQGSTQRFKDAPNGRAQARMRTRNGIAKAANVERQATIDLIHGG